MFPISCSQASNLLWLLVRSGRSYAVSQVKSPKSLPSDSVRMLMMIMQHLSYRKSMLISTHTSHEFSIKITKVTVPLITTTTPCNCGALGVIPICPTEAHISLVQVEDDTKRP